MDANEADVLGSNSKKINVGDHVLVKRDSVNFAQKGEPRKFASKTYDFPYRVKTAVCETAFILEHITDVGRRPPCRNPQNESNLIRVDLPEMDMHSSKGKRIEIYSNDLAVWIPWKIRKVAIDGRVQLESLRDPSVVRWSDLTQSRYRWVSEYVGNAEHES